MQVSEAAAGMRAENRETGTEFDEIPCIFRVIRELTRRDGFATTASTTTQSARREIFPARAWKPAFRGLSSQQPWSLDTPTVICGTKGPRSFGTQSSLLRAVANGPETRLAPAETPSTARAHCLIRCPRKRPSCEVSVGCPSGSDRGS
jgi:hypothetical protein